MPNSRLRTLFRWRQWTKKDWAIAFTGCTIIVFTLTLFSDSITNDKTFDLSAEDDLVDLTFLSNARRRGAFCLDGSIPAYHFQPGFGSGSNNWLLHIEGGGWCDSVESCAKRQTTPLGSSNYMEPMIRFSGILSRDPSENPEFFEWNKVKILYCDGASLAGHPESEFKNGTKLLFRGQLIWEALMDELLSKGLSNAKQALLTGCSAGGLATLIHCDNFRELLPKDATVKCLADAGFFLDEKDVRGNLTMRSFYQKVFHLQGIEKSLHKNCLTRRNSSKWRCLFPQEIVKDIKTPLFLVHPGYDFWQIQHILVPDVSDMRGYWKKCRLSLQYCDPSQIQVLQGFRDSLLQSLSGFRQKEGGGLFVNSCFIHCQTWMAVTWHSPTSPRINNKTIAETVGDWYFDRKVVKQIDCPYPCNPTCYNVKFI